MYKTFSLRPLSIRYALSLFVLPVLLWTCMLTTVSNQVYADSTPKAAIATSGSIPTAQGITFSIFATDNVPQESFEVVFPGASPTSACVSFTPNQWSPKSAGNVQGITRIDSLTLFPHSSDCKPKKSGEAIFYTSMFLSISELKGTACTFDYRTDELSGCVSQSKHFKTVPSTWGLPEK